MFVCLSDNDVTSGYRFGLILMILDIYVHIDLGL